MIDSINLLHICCCTSCKPCELWLYIFIILLKINIFEVCSFTYMYAPCSYIMLTFNLLTIGLFNFSWIYRNDYKIETMFIKIDFTIAIAKFLKVYYHMYFLFERTLFLCFVLQSVYTVGKKFLFEFKVLIWLRNKWPLVHIR